MNWTEIEWTDLTSNPIRGTAGNWHCVKISEGCRNCYAETINRRWGGPEYKDGADTLRLDLKELDRLTKKQVIDKKRIGGKSVFLCDMTDLFQNNVKTEWIAAIFKVIRLRPDLVFQVLTKRPDRLRFTVLAEILKPWPRNLHMGVTVESDTALWRLATLRELKAAHNIPVVFASCEPLLSPLDLRGSLDFLDWVIVGGESGKAARPMHPKAVRTIRDDCHARRVPFFFKQWGEWAPVGPLYRFALRPGDTIINRDFSTWSVDDGNKKDPWIMRRVGKKSAGAVLDGKHHKAIPAVQFTIGS